MQRYIFFCLAILSLASISLAQPHPWKVYDAWPFDTTEAAKRQVETAAAIKLPIVQTIRLGDQQGLTINFRLIPAATYTMGSPTTESGHENDETLHQETISDPFYMMETMMTLEQYRALMHSEPADWPKDDPKLPYWFRYAPDDLKDAAPKFPACVVYRDVVDKVLPALSKLAPAGWRVILPDAVRMQYAARAGVATMTPGGDTPQSAADYAWSKENSENKLHPVAQKKPNAWGLYDVIGNRWQWLWVGANKNLGDDSPNDHLVYGGAYVTEVGGNGTRLANILISHAGEAIRFALISTETALPKGHPDLLRATTVVAK